MDEQATEQVTEQVSENGQERPAHKATFASPSLAKAVTPPSQRFKVYEVTAPDGSKVFVSAQNTELAISLAAREAGWKAEVAEPKGPGAITKERVAAKLAELTDEELAEMGLTRKKGKK